MCFSDIDECLSSPCDNGGTCVDQVNGFVCTCAQGFTGVVCQTGRYICLCVCMRLVLLQVCVGVGGWAGGREVLRAMQRNCDSLVLEASVV